MDIRLTLAALHLLRDDYVSLKLRQRLQAVAQSAEQAAANPTDANLQNTFSTSVEELRQALKGATANDAPLSLRKAIRRLGLEHLVGEHLHTRLHGVLSRTPFLLQQAAQELKTISNKTDNEFNIKVAQGISLLEQYGVKPLKPEAALAEVGILLPTSLTQNDLIETTKNLKQWECVIRDFSEVTSGKAPNTIPIAAVSSGSLEAYLSLDVEGAKALAIVVSTLVGGFIALSKARSRRKEMEDENYPKKVLDGAKDYEEELLKYAEAEATEKVLNLKSSTIDEGRANELRTAVRRDVHFIAKSINRGVDVEIAPPQLEDKAASPTSQSAVIAELRRLSQQISVLSRSLPDRTEPIAELPEADPGATAYEVEPKPPTAAARAAEGKSVNGEKSSR